MPVEYVETRKLNGKHVTIQHPTIQIKNVLQINPEHVNRQGGEGSCEILSTQEHQMETDRLALLEFNSKLQYNPCGGLGSWNHSDHCTTWL